MKDRFYGALFGLVIGDALGAPQVYDPITGRSEITDMSYPSQYGELPGVWSDNTSMTLCLLESLLKSGGVDQKDQLNRYAMWYYDGHLTATGHCDDITKVMLEAIKNFTNNGITNQSSTQMQDYNCSLVRTLAVALYHPQLEQKEQTLQIAERSSYTTHGSKLAGDTCKLLTHMIILAINGADKKQLLSSQVLEGLNVDRSLIKLIKLRKYNNHQLDDCSGTNNVYDSFMVALKCFAETDNFRDGVLMAVNNSIDCDTVASIYGALAGAHYGIEQIPWIDELVQTPLIMEVMDCAWNSLTNNEHSDEHSDEHSEISGWGGSDQSGVKEHSALDHMEFEGSNVEIEVEDEDEDEDEDGNIRNQDQVEVIPENDNQEITVKKATKEIDMVSLTFQ